MSRVLLLATTTGYQTRAFETAAAELGVELVYATDRCHVLDDPWRDRAIAVRFYDEESAVADIVERARHEPIDGILAVGDRPTVVAARVGQVLGLPANYPQAVATARNKQRLRACLTAAGLHAPEFMTLPLTTDPRSLRGRVAFPAVIKPVALSGSRGVMRVDDDNALVAAWRRLHTVLQSPDIRSERNIDHESVHIEAFIPGREFAVEGLLTHGGIQTLAIFDKADPLNGPFFEETIYVTPSRADETVQRAIGVEISRAVQAIGLRHGPIHAECRVNDAGVFVLEVAARPIGGLCAGALRFTRDGEAIGLEQLLLRHALGESSRDWQREGHASGVMMVPIPRRGIYRRVRGVEAAKAVTHVDDIRVTAKVDQVLLPLPEGASYLGFIFARAATPEDVERALRGAHERLEFTIDPEIPMLQSAHG
jgi:biotin carboxylase